MAAITSNDLKRPNWQIIILCVLGFWLSGSLVLDLIIMPGLYGAGMMGQPGFASAGYSIFWVFNRVELLCASLALTGLLALNFAKQQSIPNSRIAIALSAILLVVALIDTYGLTPQMSALGLSLNWFEPVSELPAGMLLMQGGYWVLEVLKLVTCGTILRLCYQD